MPSPRNLARYHTMPRLASHSLLAWSCLCLLIISHCHAQTLKSLISLSQDLAGKSHRSSGSINIIETSDDGDLPICYLPFLAGFSDANDRPLDAAGSYAQMAGIALALEHLNTGNGMIVPELDGMNERCPLRFYTNSFDTKGRQAGGLNQIIKLTDGENGGFVPCAILGALFSRVSIPTSIISSLRGFPQISPQSTSSRLDDKEQHRLFGRTVPNDDGTSEILLAHLASWNVNYVAVPFINDAHGNSFVEGLRNAVRAKKSNLTIATVSVNQGASDAEISHAVTQLRDTQYTYFFAIIYPNALVDRVMKEAYRQKIAGTGLHTWLFSVSVGTPLTTRSFPPGDPLVDAYRGTGILSVTGGVSGTTDLAEKEAFNALVSSMRQLKADERDIAFLRDRLPTNFSGSDVTGREGFLSEPSFATSFLYDAVVGLGLAACNLMPISKAGDFFDGNDLYRAFVNTTFRGTSGLVKIDPLTGSREATSAFYSVTNFVDFEDPASARVRFERAETGYFYLGKWVELNPYIFNDGSQKAPLDRPPALDNRHRLGARLKAGGYVLCGAILGLSIGFGSWTYYNRDMQVVRASQPIFLYIILAGTMVMGASIIPLTIGPGDIAYQIFPWMLAIGFSLTFSALFTKTLRIKKIMQSAAKFKRIKLSALDVMKPMFVLLALNIIILIVWTVNDPLLETINDVPPVNEFGYAATTYATCDSDRKGIFIAALGVVNLGSLVIALVQAYQARNISTEFSESAHIFRAMSIVLYGSFLGIPILVISGEFVEAYYFVWAGLIFIICSSILLLMFVPKIVATRAKNKTEAHAQPHWKRTAVEAGKGKAEEEDIGILTYHSKQDALEEEIIRLRKENYELKHRGLERGTPEENLATPLIEEGTSNH